MPDSGDAPQLDGTRLELITRGDAGLAAEFLAALIEEADAAIARLRGAFTAGEPIAVRDLAHALKSMSAELGAQRLRAAAAALEAEADPARWPARLDAAVAALTGLRLLAGDGVQGPS
jgi:HPt (histidine-containing phosphotransfer) domain-containing protein